MKNIALLAPDFSVEHCQDFIKGVIEYCENLPDVNLFITQTLLSHDSKGVFDYQYWSSIELLKSDQIDAYIIISGIYCSSWTKHELVKKLGSFNGRPVISASIDLEIDNSYAVIHDCRKSYSQVIHHLKEKHGCKKIAFMAANSTGSQEAQDRFESYKNALKECGLEYDEKIVFEGGFVTELAYSSIKERYNSKDQIDFDSIVCASDLMATGCIHALNELGVSIPNDVKVIGFDDAIFASLSSPKLSTINQNIVAQGAKCAEVVLKVIEGGKVKNIIQTDLYPMFRQSCGCIDIGDARRVFKDVDGQCIDESGMKGSVLDLYQNEILEKHKYSSLLDLVCAANTLRQVYFNLNYLVDVAMLSDMAVCLYEEPTFSNKHEDCVIPQKVEMYMYSTRKTADKVFKPNIIFNPHHSICPINSIREEKGVYIVYPIFSGEANYGYIVGKPRKNNFSAYTVNLRILTSAISSAVEYTNNLMQKEALSNENQNLSRNMNDFYHQSQTDDLTKILNRRGFMEVGQRSIDIMQEMNTSCVIFFADMDGLKVINDTYGHEMGDKAIKLQAEVLKNAFRNSDVVGRLSGDEFGIVANSMSLANVGIIREKVEKLNKEFSEKNELPFTLSISLGAVDLTKSSMLSKLLAEADGRLYEEKRKKYEAKKTVSK